MIDIKARYQIMPGPNMFGEVVWALVDTKAPTIEESIIGLSNERSALIRLLCSKQATTEYELPGEVIMLLYNN